MKRAALGVLAGYLAWTALWLLGNLGVHALYPAELDAFARGQPLTAAAPLLLTLALSVVCSLLAGATTARIAGDEPRRPVLVVAGLLLLTGVGVQASVWSSMPVAYHLAFLLLLVPACLLGGRPRRA